MSTCLVTRLQEAVTDTDLLKLDEFEISFTDSATYASTYTNNNQYKLRYVTMTTDPATFTLIGDAYFYDSSIGISSSLGATVTINPIVSAENYIYIYNPSGTDFKLRISSKYYHIAPMALINAVSGGTTYMKKGGLVNITNLYTNGCIGGTPQLGFTGSFESFCANIDNSLLPLLGPFYLNSPLTDQFTGNLLSLPLEKYTEFQVGGQPLLDQCDFSTLCSRLTSLKYAPSLSGCPFLIGDVSTARLSPTCTGSTGISLNNMPDVYGDVCTFFANLPSNFRQVSYKSDPNLTGNLGIIPNNIVFISNRDYVTGGNSQLTYTKSASRTHVLACEDIWITSGLDDFLNDMAELSGSGYGSDSWYYRIALYGTRTSASDAAISTLTAKGWTVSVTAR